MAKQDRAERAKLKKFLTELTELTERHGIQIGGCGDCGSPWVIPLKSNAHARTLLDHLMYCPVHETYGAYDDHNDC